MNVENPQSDLTCPKTHDGTEPWSAVAIRLLQGAVYHDDRNGLWNTLLQFQSTVDAYFAKLGVRLTIDETDGVAYLVQSDHGGESDEQADVPGLFRRVSVGYDATLLCVLLRDLLLLHEETDLLDERCVVPQSKLFELWREFSPSNADEVKLQRALTTALRKLEEFKFVRRVSSPDEDSSSKSDAPDEKQFWEIRRLIKARVSTEELTQLKESLLAHSQQASHP